MGWRDIPLSMLIPLLRRSRRHLVASIHPSSLSQHPALSLGSGHAFSPPLHTREQHHHYCKWQLTGGSGRIRCGERPALNFTSSWYWMGIINRDQWHVQKMLVISKIIFFIFYMYNSLVRCTHTAWRFMITGLIQNCMFPLISQHWAHAIKQLVEVKRQCANILAHFWGQIPMLVVTWVAMLTQ